MVLHGRNKRNAGQNMTITTLANAIQTLQSNIISILQADTTLLTFTHANKTTDSQSLSKLTIVDGIPAGLLRGEGFPYIIVHTPEIDSTRLTMRKHKEEMTIHIEIIDRMEGNVRILLDGVISAINNAQVTTKGSGYWWFGRKMRNNINFTPLEYETGMKPVWHADLFLTYLWTGN